MLAVPLLHSVPAVDRIPGVRYPHRQHQGGAAPRPQHPPGLLGQGHSWYSATCLTLKGTINFNKVKRSLTSIEENLFIFITNVGY